jgi:hypothetical protein
MTKPERLLAVVGVAVVASAVLLVMYVRQSNPADAQASGCAGQRARLGQTLDQVRFSTSAEHAVSTAVTDSDKTRLQYLKTIAATQRLLAASHVAAHDRAGVDHDLAQASWILNDQHAPLQQAQAILAQEEREVASAMPLVSEASQDLQDEDCTALSLTLAKSGWPKDRLLSQLAQAAHLNAQVSDKLESALDLILQAQHDVRAYSVAAK